jgi:hypothetical protein
MVSFFFNGPIKLAHCQKKKFKRTWEATHLINRRGEFGDLRRKKLVEIWRLQWIFFHKNSLYEQHYIVFGHQMTNSLLNKKCNIHCILTLVLKILAHG